MRFSSNNAVAFQELPTIDEIKRAPIEHKIGFNDYNYCGAGTLYHLKKSGKYESMMNEAGKKKIGKAPYGVPRNNLDKACMNHDKVYADEDAELDEVRNADNQLKREALNIMKKSKNIGEKIRAGIVAGSMAGKTKLEDVGLMKKGSFSKAEEVRKKINTDEIDKFKDGGKVMNRKKYYKGLTEKQEKNLNEGLKKSLEERHKNLLKSKPLREAFLKKYCEKRKKNKIT